MKVKVNVINCLISKRRKNGFFTNLNPFFKGKCRWLEKTYMVMKKKVSFIDTKTKQMMNINVKVNVKVTNGTFSTKAKK